MSRQFRSDDTVSWDFGFGQGTYDVTFGSSITHGWDGITQFQAQGIISGTAGQTSFTKPAGWGHTGLCLLHQTRGTGAGNWELAYVDFSGANAVADKPLQNSYTTGAQIVTLSNGTAGYKNVTVNSGVTLAAPAWNGSTGGILAILASGIVTVSGSIGASTTGFVGGHKPAGNQSGRTGEGYAGASFQVGGIQNNSNGGGSALNGQKARGAGGGNGAAGGNGAIEIGTGIPGGVAAGTASLTSAQMGGGGGSGADNNPGDASNTGGYGGGIIFIFSKYISVTGSILNNGGNGNSSNWPAGGGAGGSTLIKSQVATLGSNLLTASGGAGGTASGGGGAGGVGRIHLDYSASYTGTTSPTLDATLDPTITGIKKEEESYSFLM